MSDVQLTPAQQSVVDDRGGALLVSAAAGSGKTRVLVERLMKRVCDKTDPANIDDFLIITYTKAAAAELRVKIADALAKRQSEQPENRHLQRQSVRLCMAQISTIHAFCASVLRDYGYLIDYPSDFRIAEEQETDSLRQNILNRILSDQYEHREEDAAFAALCEQIGYGRDDRGLRETVLRVHNAARCRAEPEHWLQKCAEAAADVRAEQTVWGEYLMDELKHLTRYALNELQRLCEFLTAQNEKLAEKYLPALQDDIEQIKKLESCETWDEVIAAKITVWKRLANATKNDAPEMSEHVKIVRNKVKDDISDLQDLFYADSRQVMQELSESRPAICGLVDTVLRLDSEFAAEKKRRRIADYSDLEHLSLRLLTDRSTGKPTPAAKQVAEHYREILVDEFQDSNEIQERLFEAVSHDGTNRFMVGDVKQSIYRFRLAEPEIFLKKYKQYAPCGSAEEGQPRKITLSQNFRSRKEILACVNDVFSLVMSERTGELDYTEDQALLHGLPYPESPQPKIELHCIEPEGKSEQDEQSPQKTAIEAEFAAERIEALLQSKTPITENDTLRPIRPEDIVILLRSPGGSARYYVQALAKRGIACTSDRGGDLLQTTEAQVLCSILQIIDNPHRDVPLLTAMASPVFCFSPDEIALPRTEERERDYYDSLCEYAAKSEKHAGFLNWLLQMREASRFMTLRELLDAVLRSTDLKSVFSSMQNGTARARNLDALCSYADSFSRTDGGSLAEFCARLEHLRESGTALPLPNEQSSGAVRLMSIHSSKGLEFPVVYLADLSKKFNTEDLNQKILMDDTLLIGTEVVKAQEKSRYNGLAKTAISGKRKRQLISEEMRVLYVAMTRAREMLIMSYCSSKLTATLKKLNRMLRVPLHPETSASVQCMGEWILYAALRRTEAGELFARCGANEYSSVSQQPWIVRYHYADRVRVDAALTADRAQTPGERKTEPPAYLPQELYTAKSIPSKLTATQLKGRVIDEEAAQQTRQARPAHWRKPSFLPQQPLSGSEKGSATHLFMQFARYEACTSLDAIRAEKRRLVDECFLRPEQAQAVEEDRIARLFAGPLGKRILAAKELRREFKFSILTDACEFFPDGGQEQVMLQGVVDCFWIEDGGLVITDFKTDRISGELSQKAENYRPQLSAYAKALSRIYQLPVRELWLYFFDTDTAVRL